MAPRPQYSAATRAQVVTMKQMGASNRDIEAKTGVPARTIRRICHRAADRGFDPTERPILEDHHVKNAPKSGRPKKRTEEKINEVLALVTRDRYAREKTCANLAASAGVSAMTLWRILRSQGFRKAKPTRKPCLTDEMKQARLKFCRDHADWDEEQWYSVIWTDETSISGTRRGAWRLWRRRYERHNKAGIRMRFKKPNWSLMFWGCFSYYEKGPCYIYKPKTAAQKRESQRQIDELNRELKAEAKLEWELSTGARRLTLRNLPRRRP